MSFTPEEIVSELARQSPIIGKRPCECMYCDGHQVEGGMLYGVEHERSCLWWRAFMWVFENSVEPNEPK